MLSFRIHEILAIWVALLVAFQSLAIAQEPSGVTGIVVDTNLEAQTVTIRVKSDQKLTFVVDSATSITGREKEVKFSAIQVGSSIGIRYLQRETKFVALAINADGEIPPPLPVNFPPRKPVTPTPKPN